jgi:hypothetical protein
MRLISVITVIIFVHCEFVDSYRSKTDIPSIMDTEASQWLSTRNMPRRWRQQSLTNQPSDEVDRFLKQLQLINDNGIRRSDSQAIDGVTMEVLYELNRQGK